MKYILFYLGYSLLLCALVGLYWHNRDKLYREAKEGEE